MHYYVCSTEETVLRDFLESFKCGLSKVNVSEFLENLEEMYPWYR